MLTLKQEDFCQAYIQNGGNASDAFRAAYPSNKSSDKTINEAASRLLKNSKVMARVAKLRAAIEVRHQITVDDLIKELEEARSQAVGLNVPQLSVAVSATMGKAKMLGFLSDKVELSGKVGLESVPMEELASSLNALLSKLK